MEKLLEPKNEMQGMRKIHHLAGMATLTHNTLKHQRTMTRIHQISLKLTQAQKDAFTAAANASGVSLNQWVLSACVQAAIEDDVSYRVLLKDEQP
ncbi:MAG: DUF1778 domain-containing protein [Prochlorothrix sp.]